MKSHCIIELFGHTKLGGFVQEAPFGGGELLQVTIPETSSQPEFTKFINVKAIYAITPCDQQIAQQTAEHVKAAPLSEYGLEKAVMANAELLGKIRSEPALALPPFNGMTHTVNKCSTCGKTHNIDFAELAQPDSEGFTHWGICQNSMQPVFLKPDFEKLLGGEETFHEECR